jgi:DUF4097 and DUF4098 domain-containing protein YvlB
MRWEVLVLAAVALAAGCIGSFDAEEASDDDGELASAEAEETEPETVERTLVFEDDVAPAVAMGRPGTSWSTTIGPHPVSMELELSWNETANGFGLEVEHPNGDTHEIPAPEDPTATSVTGEIPDPGAGTYSFHVTAEGPVAPDHARLEAHVVQRVAGDQPVTVRKTGDGYRAEITYEATGDVGQQVQATVDTVNGAIKASSTDGGDQADVTVVAWAEADTREQARERARSIAVTTDEILARAEAENWENRGASADIGVPAATTVDGELDTTNGAIAIDGLDVGDLAADTTNGAITGGLAGEGSLVFDTTNGGVDVAFTPTGDSEVEADTTNGAIQLALAEDADTGYEIDASTTNGRITEDMEEASLQGSEEEEATLVTEGFADRSIQVTGETDTTNGEIHFGSR